MLVIISIIVIYLIPVIFAILFIENLITLLKQKKTNEIKKSTKIKTSIFGTILALILIFYTWMNYMLTTSLTLM